MIQLVVFTLDEQLYALQLAAIERVVRAVAVTPVPKAPVIVLGLIDVRGRMLPVVSLRHRFGLPDREIDLSDQFIIAHTATRPVVIVVDAVVEVVEIAEQQMVAREEIFPGLAYVRGVAKLGDSLVFIHDLDAVLTYDEEQTLDALLKELADG